MVLYSCSFDCFQVKVWFMYPFIFFLSYSYCIYSSRLVSKKLGMSLFNFERSFFFLSFFLFFLSVLLVSMVSSINYVSMVSSSVLTFRDSLKNLSASSCFLCSIASKNEVSVFALS